MTKTYKPNSPEWEIEQLIDKHGLTSVVDSVCQICYEKADHIRSSYGDEQLAKQWEDAGFSLVNPNDKYKDKPFPT